MGFADDPEQQHNDKRSKVLGFITGFLVSILFPIGFIIAAIIWICLQHENPHFARGVKNGAFSMVIVSAIVILGAVSNCIRGYH